MRIEPIKNIEVMSDEIYTYFHEICFHKNFYCNNYSNTTIFVDDFKLSLNFFFLWKINFQITNNLSFLLFAFAFVVVFLLKSTFSLD